MPFATSQRSFVVSDLFFEAQTGILLAPFYVDLLKRFPPAPHGGNYEGRDESTGRRRGRQESQLLSTHALLTALQQASEHTDRLPYKALAVMHCLSAAPNRLSSRLSVQSSESLRYQTTTLAFTADGAGAEGRRSEEEQGSEQVLLLGQESFEPHSGFCDKTLNSLRADFVLSASGPASAASSAPPGASSTTVTSSLADAASDFPWLLPSGDENSQVLSALCSKVLAVLSDKPGAGLRTLHTALVVLSTAHTESLLRLMVERGLVRTRHSSSSSSSSLSVAPFSNSSSKGGGGGGGGVNGRLDLFGYGATAVFAPRAGAGLLPDTHMSLDVNSAQLRQAQAQEQQQRIGYFAANLIGLH